MHKNSISSYTIGFILSIVLTFIPFWIVINSNTTHQNILIIVITMAVIQIFIHLIFFMHMRLVYAERWNLISLLFTFLIITIIITGSLWIMYNLNINMIVQ
ncbi:cytochrome o ubiquinol oxidase subunit IV [Candidatus Profftia lariciata]|uniref:cytochrome o ubiquinol oxidase subunit IV n=1 Tax=Candidatus Profftia lariciata TaxID=1987921 RepID=UPI001D01B2C8|nr:cytochrome o ubiquinol oxidase subunit IV [Candidatus Profftia lariciata]